MESGKYTAKEIVEKAGFSDVEFGKERVRIGGIRGIVTKDHLIRVQRKSELEVVVGNEVKKI
jgi:hypothetical protein